VPQPEGNGVAERFIRTLKENLLWVRTIAERTDAWERPLHMKKPVPSSSAARSAEPQLKIVDTVATVLQRALTSQRSPASGPGPVLNKVRVRTGPQSGRSAITQLVGDYNNPILKPQAAEAVKKFGEIELRAGCGNLHRTISGVSA
jgi:hypothetical protein